MEEVINQVYTRWCPCDWSSRGYMPTGSSVIGQVMVGLTQTHGAAAAMDPVNPLVPL